MHYLYPYPGSTLRTLETTNSDTEGPATRTISCRWPATNGDAVVLDYGEGHLLIGWYLDANGPNPPYNGYGVLLEADVLYTEWAIEADNSQSLASALAIALIDILGSEALVLNEDGSFTVPEDSPIHATAESSPGGTFTELE